MLVFHSPASPLSHSLFWPLPSCSTSFVRSGAVNLGGRVSKVPRLTPLRTWMVRLAFNDGLPFYSLSEFGFCGGDVEGGPAEACKGSRRQARLHVRFSLGAEPLRLYASVQHHSVVGEDTGAPFASFSNERRLSEWGTRVSSGRHVATRRYAAQPALCSTPSAQAGTINRRWGLRPGKRWHTMRHTLGRQGTGSGGRRTVWLQS
jgi:hypothetical protein